jgi:hypothetical protein
MNKKQRMYEEIEKHGANLNAIFKTKLDNVALCKALFRLEHKAHLATTCLCNTNTLNLLELNQYTGYDVKQTTEEDIDAYFDKIKIRLTNILGKKAEKICFVNFDPRGYALKIKAEWINKQYEESKGTFRIYTDWGGYGILAPDFR